MKKGLSILLIAAALFGFYGGAVNLQDVLACMKYWEKEGEKSTADMNKLEDGLKQLQDNEQAYLDGQVQLADGEKTLADGEAQYAQGLADYAAAPGKLATGKAQLDEGYDSYKNLIKLMKGLNTVKAHGTRTTGKHDVYWHDAFSNQLATGRKLIVKTLNGQKDMVGLLEGLAKDNGGSTDLVSAANNAKSYPAFDNVVAKKLEPTFRIAAKALRNFAVLAKSKASDLSDGNSLLTNIDNAEQGYAAKAGSVPDGETLLAAAQKEGSPFEGLVPYLKGIKQSAGDAFAMFPASCFVKKSVAGELNDFLDSYGDKIQALASSNEDVAKLYGAMSTLAGYNIRLDNISNAEFKQYVSAVAIGLEEKAAPMLEEYAKTAEGSADQFKAWDAGYQTLYASKDGKGSNDLASKSEGIPYAFTQMVTNKTIKAALKENDPKLIKILKKYTGNRLKNEDLDSFDSDLVYISRTVIPRAQKVLAKVKSSAVKQLADGEKQLAQGKKDYAAAPGKLADAERQLADGRKQLEDGKAQLAQYEDGEQQVRDGLATLMSTEPSGGLESILDRRDGDDDFDNGDEHLDLAEGLEAVDVGRGYQADSGDLITAELVKRGAGTAAGIAAGVLALLAALLSFLKKNKGAAISGCIAAIAAAGGVAVGTSAGTEFSAQAGSTVGMLPWAAAGILAGIAVVFAIVHFSNPKEAK